MARDTECVPLMLSLTVAVMVCVPPVSVVVLSGPPVGMQMPVRNSVVLVHVPVNAHRSREGEHTERDERDSDEALHQGREVFREAPSGEQRTTAGGALPRVPPQQARRTRVIPLGEARGTRRDGHRAELCHGAIVVSGPDRGQGRTDDPLGVIRLRGPPTIRRMAVPGRPSGYPPEPTLREFSAATGRSQPRRFSTTSCRRAADHT